MSLYSDVQELKKLWKSTSFKGKVFLLLSSFLAITPIATLSETIVAWKGFFKDALDWYEKYILFLIKAPLRLIQIDLDSAFANGFVIMCLFMFAFIRMRKYKPRVSAEEFSVLEPKISVNFLGVVALIISLIGSYPLAMLLGDGYAEFLRVFIPLLLFCYTLSVPFCYVRTQYHVFHYYFPIFMSIVLVGIFAAINKGLHG